MSEYVIAIPAGPIWSNEDAKKKCPVVCAAHLGKWNGQWRTIVEGQMSVCECVLDTNPSGKEELVVNVIAGPIWSNEDAKEKCPIICASYGGKWNGQWRTVINGKMSICECVFKI